MSRIRIVDLEVFYHVGVTDEERARPQRLLISVELSCDFGAAALSDRIEETVDYYALSRDLLKFGHNRSWKLLEKLASDASEMILDRYKPRVVRLEIKKFPIPEARYVSVGVTRARKF
jgi:dihydroneopterin aldolase